MDHRQRPILSLLCIAACCHCTLAWAAVHQPALSPNTAASSRHRPPRPQQQHSFLAPAKPAARWKPISVTDFGAVGDGRTNDAPAIQSAIDAALADGSLVVWFPPGDYRTNTTLLASGSGRTAHTHSARPRERVTAFL